MDTEDKKNILPPSQSSQEEDGADDSITLTVQDQAGGEVSFKIKRKTPFRKLMAEYCKRKNLDFKAVRFSFDGERIKPDEPISAIKDIQDGDTIDVNVEQQGGDLQ